MPFLILVLIFSALSMNGCASSKNIHKDKVLPATMMEVYSSAVGQSQKDVAEFVERNLKEQRTFGYTKPYIPVINEPVVRKVWIPDHKSEDNSDVLVAGHWVYLMIEPSKWFVDGKTVDTNFPIIIPGASKTGLKENGN